MKKFFPTRCLPLFCAALLVAGCASLPTDYEKQPSTAIRDTHDAKLGIRVADLVQARTPGESGLHLLPYGVDALAARLALIDQAERGVDVQYYQLLPDIAGDLLLIRLVAAANRGVRVRILLDDISTKGYEEAFAVLSANDNIEIRLTNPFANRKARMLNFATDFQRLNHRMHNKSITFDNVVTIVGGRNMGAGYFGASKDANFLDLDVIGVGPLADQVSTEFDRYWNAAETIPVGAFVAADDSPEAAAALAKRFAIVVSNVQTSPYAEALDGSLVDIVLQDDAESLTWAPARLLYDLPYAGWAESDYGETTLLGTTLIDALEQAVDEVFLVSPYFVPGESGVERMRGLRDRGVRVVVLTNSLASNDVAAVYGGYEEYQRPLLEMGVELWEVMAFPDVPGDERGMLTNRKTLHAKTFTIDRERLFVGSFNWDPRSRNINSEMGAMIESRALATELLELVGVSLPDFAWRLRLSEDGEVEWVNVDPGVQEVVFSEPPQSSSSQRRVARLTRLDALEGQL